MKIFRKIISLLMTVAMLIGVVSVGIGTVTAGAFNTADFSGGLYAKGVNTDFAHMDIAFSLEAWTQTEKFDLSLSNYMYIAFKDSYTGCSLAGFSASVNGLSFELDSVVSDNTSAKVYKCNVSSLEAKKYTISATLTARAGGTANTSISFSNYEFYCSHSGGYKQFVETVAPTCTKEGYDKYHCDRCNEDVPENTVPSAHSYAWRVQTPATLTTTGVEEEYCTVCSETSGETREIPVVQYTFKKGRDSTAMIDNVRGLLYGISEDSSDLESYFTLKNCTLQYSKPIGTGTDVKVMVGSELAKELTVIVFGDVTADGVVDSYDVSNINSVVNFETEYDTMALNMAGDVFEDGYIDAIDLTFLIAAANVEFSLDQRGVIEPYIDDEDDPGQDDPGQDDPVDPNYQYTFLNYSYGPYGERSLLDLRIPEGASGDMGLILYIHGGTWLFGSKEDMAGLANDGFDHGYAVASVNYRYISSVDYNGVLNDIQTAVGVIKSLGAENGVNFKKMMVVGYSAGGHLALMYSYTKAGSSPITPVAVWDRSGPADLTFNAWLDVSSEIPAVFSALVGVPGYINRDNFKSDGVQLALINASPVAKISSSTVPTIISHGTADNIVPYENAIRLNNILTQNGVRHVLYPYQNSTHGLEDQSAEAQSKETFYSWCNEYIGAPYSSN